MQDIFSADTLRTHLDTVIDPELGIGIVTLGLIRDIHIAYDTDSNPVNTHVIMTLTTPFCPYADAILEQVETTITLHGFGIPTVELSFDPPWQPSEDLRATLGM
jgi:metal-sulfur cluster biosynthetic enzyme